MLLKLRFAASLDRSLLMQSYPLIYQFYIALNERNARIPRSKSDEESFLFPFFLYFIPKTSSVHYLSPFKILDVFYELIKIGVKMDEKR